MRCDRRSKETETLVKVGSENLCEECYEEDFSSPPSLPLFLPHYSLSLIPSTTGM